MLLCVYPSPPPSSSSSSSSYSSSFWSPLVACSRDIAAVEGSLSIEGFMLEGLGGMLPSLGELDLGKNLLTGTLPGAWSRGREDLGRHVCRTKLFPKNFEIDTKNGLKNAKKDPKNNPKRDRNIVLARLRPLKNISPALF